jgi:chemotaxis protein MotB
MAAHRSMRRRRGGDHGGHADERWLLTYADMITLLMALFMVMFSISSVKEGKYEQLTRSLKDAFSGQIFTGGTSFQQTGASAGGNSQPTAEPPIPALRPITGKIPSMGSASEEEDEDFRQVKSEVEEYTQTQGLKQKVTAEITRRGLVIRMLTDDVLFNSGEANLRPEGRPLLDEMSRLLKAEVRHPIVVEGYTDRVPISTAQFPTNWELSAVRATSVLRYLIRHGVAPGRLSSAGYGALHPVDTNASETGRRRNRRVEIVLTRLTKP